MVITTTDIQLFQILKLKLGEKEPAARHVSAAHVV